MNQRPNSKTLSFETTRVNTGEGTGINSINSIFLNKILKKQPTKAKIDKWDYSKIKSSAQQRKQHRQL